MRARMMLCADARLPTKASACALNDDAPSVDALDRTRRADVAEARDERMASSASSREDNGGVGELMEREGGWNGDGPGEKAFGASSQRHHLAGGALLSASSVKRGKS